MSAELELMPSFHLSQVILENEVVIPVHFPVDGLHVVGVAGSDSDVVDHRITGLIVKIGESQLRSIIDAGRAGKAGAEIARGTEKGFGDEGGREAVRPGAGNALVRVACAHRI